MAANGNGARRAGRIFRRRVPQPSPAGRQTDQDFFGDDQAGRIPAPGDAREVSGPFACRGAPEGSRHLGRPDVDPDRPQGSRYATVKELFDYVLGAMKAEGKEPVRYSV